jgi:acyl-CoA thioesterase
MSAAPQVATAFDRATAVSPVRPGVWSAVCDGAWSAPRGPNGGYLAAIVLRAMVARLADPAREARSLTLHYLRPPADGEVQIEVAVERAGRSVSSLSARLSQDGRLCVLALAAFALDFPSAADYAPVAPSVPPAEELEAFGPFDGAPPIVHRMSIRPALGAPPFSGAPEALTGGWLRFAEPRAADAAALAMYSDAWMPAPFPRLAAPTAAPTIDLTIHFRAPAATAALSPEDHVLGVFRSTASAGGFFEEDGELWSPDGTLLAQSRQLALMLPLREADAA